MAIPAEIRDPIDGSFVEILTGFEAAVESLQPGRHAGAGEEARYCFPGIRRKRARHAAQARLEPGECQPQTRDALKRLAEAPPLNSVGLPDLVSEGDVLGSRRLVGKQVLF